MILCEYFFDENLLDEIKATYGMYMRTSSTSCLITPHCSLRDNNLTATGAAALARALQHNKSLEVLK